MHPWHSEQILFFQQQKTIKKIILILLSKMKKACKQNKIYILDILKYIYK